MPTSSPSLHIEPGFSPTLLGFIAVTHGAALLASLLGGWSGWVTAGCLVAITISAAVSYDRCLRRPEVESLRLMRDGSWRVILRNGTECECELSGDSVVTPVLTLVVLAASSGMLRVPVFRDSLDPESYRALRVALRLYGVSDKSRARTDRVG